MQICVKWLILLLCLFVLTADIQAQSKRFSLISAEQSGISFSNDLDYNKDHNILLYSNYYGGAGVGIGDFNNDGLQDIFFAGNVVADRLYLNKGDFQFEDISQQAGILDDGGWSSGVVLADVNLDGFLDVYLTRELYDDQAELRANRLYINNGDLTFREQSEAYGLADTARTRHACFLDFDRDGDLDVFLLNQPPNPGNYSELYGSDLSLPAYRPRLYKNDAGHFTDISEAAGVLEPGFANSVSACDFNQDGWVDLYLANDFDQPDRLYINQQNGSFQNVLEQAMPHISFYSMGVDIADLNHDGWMEVMVLDMVAEDNYRLKANMSGMNPQTFWDVVKEGGHYQYMFNTLHLNQGPVGEAGIHFSEIGQMAGVSSTDWSWSNLFADFDNDGYQDLHITNGLVHDIRNSDAAKLLPKYIQNIANEYIRKNPNQGDVSIWDVINLKQVMQIVPSVPLVNYTYKNLGDMGFQKVIEDWGLDQPSFSNGSAYGDLDNDGDIDLVVNNINEAAFVYQNQTQQIAPQNFLRFQIPAGKPSHGCRMTIHYGEHQQSQELTSVRGMYSTSEAVFHFGLGDYEGPVQVEIHSPNNYYHYTAPEIPELNQSYMLVVNEVEEMPALGTNKPASHLFQEITSQIGLRHQHAENVYDDFEYEVLLPHKMSQFGPAIATGDLNGDGLEDMYTGGAAFAAGQLYLQTKNGSFQPHKQTAIQQDNLYEDVDACFFDADGDRDLDLYVVSGGSAFTQNSKDYQDRLYLNDGKGNFSKSTLPQLRTSGSCVRPYDFDQDGDLDLFVGGRHKPGHYPSPTDSYVLRNDSEGGAVLFTDITSSHFPSLKQIGMLTDAVWADVNQDQRVDLVVVGEWMPVIILLQTEDQHFISTPLTAEISTTGWWFSVDAADLDADGDLDLICGNLGKNYKYQARSGEPFSVHYDDFDENGWKDIVLSYYNFGEQFPLRGRSCSSEQIPDLKEKFPSYNLFASADLQEVYGIDKLNQALHYEVESFESVWWENLGNGQFKRHVLPNAAQIAPINDMLIEDLNADGHLDMLFAGNLYGSEIETPRADAGVGSLLLGDGKGVFQALPARESGWFVPYDVKQFKRLGQNKILVASNNELLRIFQLNP